MITPSPTRPENDPKAPGPRAATRRKRQQVMLAALGLFMMNGYQATTVDDILQATGLGRRTFFRYFAGKEDIVLSNVDDYGTVLVEEIGMRPAEEPNFVALARAVVTISTRQAHFESSRGLALQRLIVETPELHAALLKRHEGWIERIAAAVAGRDGKDLPGPEHILLARLIRAVLDTAGGEWLRSNGATPHVAALEHVLGVFARIKADWPPGTAVAGIPAG